MQRSPRRRSPCEQLTDAKQCYEDIRCTWNKEFNQCRRTPSPEWRTTDCELCARAVWTGDKVVHVDVYGRPVHPDVHVCAACDAQLGGRCPYCRQDDYRTRPSTRYGLVYLYREGRIDELVHVLPVVSIASIVELLDVLEPNSAFADGILEYLQHHGRLHTVFHATPYSQAMIHEYAQRHGIDGIQLLTPEEDAWFQRHHDQDVNDILRDAAGKGYRGVVERMLAMGANEYNEAMSAAARTGHRDIVERMLALGADNYDWAMYSAARAGHRDLVERMLALGADNYDWSMFGAAAGGHRDLVQRMLSLGADDYTWAWSGAAAEEHYGIASWMVSLGADPYEDVLGLSDPDAQDDDDYI